MQLTWFGHSAFRAELKGARILIDPLLSNPTFTGDKHAVPPRDGRPCVPERGKPFTV